MAKPSQYKVKYRAEWETEPEFKEWILAVEGDDRKVRCKFCQILISAHAAGLQAHAANKRHIKNIADAMISRMMPQECTTEDTYQINESTTDDQSATEVIEIITSEIEDVNRDICSFDPLNGWLSSMDGETNVDDDVEEDEEKDAVEHDSKTGLKYQKRWHMNPLFTGWLAAVDGDSTKARCLYCHVELRAHYKDLERHMKTKKHSHTATNIITEIIKESPGPQPDFYNTKAEEKKLKDVSRLSNERQILKMKCETDEDIMELLNKSENLKTIKNTNKEMENEVTQTLERVAVLKSCSSLSNHDDLIEEIVQPISTVDFQEPQSKRRKVCEELTTQMKNVIKCEMPFGDEPDVDDDDDDENHEECTNLENVDGRRRPKRMWTGSTDWSKYKKTYRREWESDPLLSGWVAPVFGDKYKAACKYCGCILRAHYTDLRQHYQTGKHVKNTDYHSSGSTEPTIFIRKKESKTRVELPVKESKVFACYTLNKSPWSRYRKRYRKQWESDPQFQGWIAPVPGDDTKARCKYCHLLMRAHFNDLKNHGRTTKHASNIAYGQPADDSNVNRPITTARTPTRPTIPGRKKKLGVKMLMTCNNDFDIYDLNRHDDTLTPISSIMNVASFNWGASPLHETTLIIPKHVHLDETLAASLPNGASPGAMFRVKKEPTGLIETAPIKRKKEKPVQQISQDDVNDGMLQNLTRSITLWEFLMMKVDKTHPNSTRPRLETILLEFKSLHEKVKNLSSEQLIPYNEPIVSSRNNILVIESQELAQCLDISVGAYKIRDPTNPRMTRNIKLMSNAIKRRVKPTVAQQPLIAENKFVESSTAAEMQSLVIQNEQLHALEIVSYDNDGHLTDCGNLITVNGHTDADEDGQLYALQISEDMDPETLKSLMQTLTMSNYTLVKKTEVQE